MTEAIAVLVRELLRDNPEVRSAFDAMRKRQLSSEEARAELGRAFLACLWEMERGRQNRWLQVLHGLRDGHSTEELVAEYLSQTVGGKDG
jgi:hypothetical protein